MQVTKTCRVLVWLGALGAFSACGDQGAESLVDPINRGQDTTGVSLTLTPDTVSLEVGDSIALVVRVTNTANTAATFRSTNAAVATVNSAGKVMGISPGTALIIATSASSAGATDGTIVSVRPLGPSAGSVHHVLKTVGIGRVRAKTTSEVAVAGTTAYTGTWGGAGELYVWNVATDNPQLIQQISIGKVSSVSDVQVSDDLKLVVASGEYGDDAGITIFNRQDDGRLALAGRFRTETIEREGSSGTIRVMRAGAHTVKLSRINGRHYAFLVQYVAVYIVDITDTTNPVLVHRFRPVEGYTHDVLVRDGLLFTADWDQGVGIWDMSGTRGGSPSKPVEISRVRTVNGSIHNFWWMQDQKTGSKQYLFAGEEGPGLYPLRTSGDVHVVDISDITKPKEVAFLHVDPATTSNLEPAGAHNFHADEQSGILYAAFYNGGVRALDTRGDLGSCTARQKSKDGRCDLRLMGREIGRAFTSDGAVGVWGVVFSRGRLYGADMLSGLLVADARILQR